MTPLHESGPPPPPECECLKCILVHRRVHHHHSTRVHLVCHHHGGRLGRRRVHHCRSPTPHGTSTTVRLSTESFFCFFLQGRRCPHLTTGALPPSTWLFSSSFRVQQLRIPPRKDITPRAADEKLLLSVHTTGWSHLHQIHENGGAYGKVWPRRPSHQGRRFNSSTQGRLCPQRR